MRVSLRASGICVFGVLLAGSALADGARWTIVESSGAVNVAAPMGAPHLASAHEALAPGATLTTGGTGRAILKSGAQQIVIGPNSRMSLPSSEGGGMTHILQDLGTLLFKVDKRPEQHFSVETPFIAAIVKGTTFTVTAGPMSHSVHVVEGLVEVATPNGNTHQFVRPGMTAIVNRSNPATIDITGTNAPSAAPINDFVPQGTEPGAPTLLDATAPTSAVSPATVTTKSASTFEVGPGALDMTALTDGLIQSAPAQTAIAGSSQTMETSSSGRTVTVDVGKGVASAGGQAAAKAAGAAETNVGSTVSTAVTTIANPGITGVETTLTNVVGGAAAANGSNGNTGGAANSTVGITASAAVNTGGNALGNTLSTVTTTLGAATGAGNGNGNGNGNGGSIASVVNAVLGTDPAAAGGNSNGNGNALGAVNSVHTGATTDSTTPGSSNGPGNSGSNNAGLDGGVTGANGNSNSNSNSNGNGVPQSNGNGSGKGNNGNGGGGG